MPKIFKAWIEYDKQQEGTPYWTYLTSSQANLQEQLIQLLASYRILVPGKEFIMYLPDAVKLIDDLEVLGVAVSGTGVWCSVQQGESKDDCCPYGMGGPAVGVEWFREYSILGYSVPDFYDLMPRNLDLAKKCNPLVRAYLESELPNHQHFNDRIRVSPDVYIPFLWDLFPARKSDEK